MRCWRRCRQASPPMPRPRRTLASWSAEPLRTRPSRPPERSLRSCAARSTKRCATRSDCARPWLAHIQPRPPPMTPCQRVRGIGISAPRWEPWRNANRRWPSTSMSRFRTRPRQYGRSTVCGPSFRCSSPCRPTHRSGASFASIRTPIFSMFPRVGIPRHFGSYQEYVSVIDAMLSTGAIPEPGFLWWDVRLRPCLGTIEIRIMDAQSRVTDAVALTALFRCLVHRCAHGPRASDISPEMLPENRYLAARDGVRAQLIDRGPARRPVQDALQELFEDCRAMAPQ